MKNASASVHQRLLNLARQTGRPFNELAQYYALERWLYRLAQSPYRSKFVLKGALMLRVWQTPVGRPTRDIDLLGRVSNEVSVIREIISAICSTPVSEDGMSFDASTVVTSRIAEDADYHGVRASFTGYLGKGALPMQIDIGFSDVITPAPDAIRYPSLLAYPHPELLAYNRETVIAEKFQAMVKLGELNSRMKDFFDIWLLATTGTFQRGDLHLAIRQTFNHRETALEMSPVCLSQGFAENAVKAAQWRAFLRRSHFTEVPESFVQVVGFISDFLSPILRMGEAEPQPTDWPSGGPWRFAETRNKSDS